MKIPGLRQSYVANYKRGVWGSVKGTGHIYVVYDVRRLMFKRVKADRYNVKIFRHIAKGIIKYRDMRRLRKKLKKNITRYRSNRLRNPMYRRSIFIGSKTAMLVVDSDDAHPDTFADGDKHVAPGRRAIRDKFPIDSSECSESNWGGPVEAKES